MFKCIPTVLLIAFSIVTGLAQSAVSVSINHLLDGEAFAFEKAVENNLEHSFHVERLQYYLSKFSLIDDNDQEVLIDDLFALVTAGESDKTIIDLGTIDANKVKALRFHIGVAQEFNHLDPAQYSADHPLAPKNPSMHWGWAGGYRFIVLEGKSSADLNQELQLHCIGNNNFQLVEIPVTAESISGFINIEIDAEYKASLTEIAINEGLIRHGDLGEIVTMVENFQNDVFSEAGSVISTISAINEPSITVFPNPSHHGYFSIDIESNSSVYSYDVYDLQGRKISSAKIDSDLVSIHLDAGGVFICVFKDISGNEITRKRLVTLE